jgi:hypothetical protein
MNQVRIAFAVAGQELAAASLGSYIMADPTCQKRLGVLWRKLEARWAEGKYQTDLAESAFGRLVASATDGWRSQTRMTPSKEATGRVVESLTKWFENGQVEQRQTVWEASQ